MTKTSPISNNSTTVASNASHRPTRNYRRSSRPYRIHMPLQNRNNNAFERWSLFQEELRGVAGDRSSDPQPVPSTVNRNVATADSARTSSAHHHLSHQVPTPFSPPMFPRLDPFDDSESPLAPVAAVPSLSLLSSNNNPRMSRIRLFCILEEALDISHSIVLENDKPINEMDDAKKWSVVVTVPTMDKEIVFDSECKKF